MLPHMPPYVGKVELAPGGRRVQVVVYSVKVLKRIHTIKYFSNYHFVDVTEMVGAYVTVM